MALMIKTAGDLLLTAICKACAINPDGSYIENGVADNSTYADDFAAAYDTYAKEGVVLGATNSGGDTTSILSVMRTDTHINVTEFAQAFATYWSTVAVDPGAPAHGGVSVAGVVNDAMDHVGDFEAAILASLTTEESKPYYHKFLRNLENMAVKKINWTITEVMPTGSPADFIENIE